MTQPLNLVFAGTPDFAAAQLAALLPTDHNIIACYTQPDRPAGRGRKLQPSPVKALALEHNIPVYQPLNFKAQEDREQLQALKPDLMIVVAYGLILPQAVLDIPRLGCINVHASLLPRWRGAAPIQRAIAAGDPETGVTIMQMEAGLDTGPMLIKVSTPIEATDTGGTLHDRLAELSGPALLQSLEQLVTGTAKPEIQNHELATYANKLSKAESRVDWQQSALAIERQIRAFNPWPVVHSTINDQNLRIWRAESLSAGASSGERLPGTVVQASKKGIQVATGEGDLLIQELQFSGGKRLAVSDILNAKAELFASGATFR